MVQVLVAVEVSSLACNALKLRLERRLEEAGVRQAEPG